MKNEYLSRVIKTLLTLAAASSVLASTSTLAAKNEPAQEKCYGIAKAGMNDCQTAGHSCSGSAVKDNQADAFIFLPKGLCTRIVGGSLVTK